jgi:Ca2+-dependent lipid-binding protein
MATYKVWLKVKDSYGNTKEIDGGDINVDLATLTPDEVSQIEAALPLDNFVTKNELTNELDTYATDDEVKTAVSEAEHNTLKYTGFKD